MIFDTAIIEKMEAIALEYSQAIEATKKAVLHAWRAEVALQKAMGETPATDGGALSRSPAFREKVEPLLKAQNQLNCAIERMKFGYPAIDTTTAPMGAESDE